MENYIVINGKKAELTKEQLKALGIDVEPKSLFDRVDGEVYFFIGSTGEVMKARETFALLDAQYSLIGNYCTDESIMQQRAYHETLSRLLWRFSMKNGGDKIDWHADTQKWYVVYNYTNNLLGISYVCACESLDPHFITREVAQRAIDEVIKPFMAANPDFV